MQICWFILVEKLPACQTVKQNRAKADREFTVVHVIEWSFNREHIYTIVILTDHQQTMAMNIHRQAQIQILYIELGRTLFYANTCKYHGRSNNGTFGKPGYRPKILTHCAVCIRLTTKNSPKSHRIRHLSSNHTQLALVLRTRLSSRPVR